MSEYRQVVNYVWCNFHREAHRDEPDFYESGEDECGPGNWLLLYIHEPTSFDRHIDSLTPEFVDGIQRFADGIGPLPSR